MAAPVEYTQNKSGESFSDVSGGYYDKTILENYAKNHIGEVVCRAHRSNAYIVCHRHIVHELAIQINSCRTYNFGRLHNPGHADQ